MRDRAWLIWLVIVVMAAGGVALGVANGVFLLPGMDVNEDAQRIGEKGDYAYGPIFAQPDQYERELLKEGWVRRIPIGRSTFGKLLVQQGRFSIEGGGPIVGRSVRASTPSAAALLSGRTQKRTEAFIHGLLRLLHERKGYVKGVSFSHSHDGYAANSLVWYIEQGFFDYYARSLSDQRELVRLLLIYERELADYSLAWFQFDSSSIVLAPQVSRPIEQALKRPRSVSPRKQLWAAYILRHELEHSVSAYDQGYEDYKRARRFRWLEEGSTDVLARWPGAAAATAKELGLRYPKRAERLAYDAIDPKAPGYDDFVTCIRTLIRLAGIDLKDPKAFDAASALIQNGPLPQMPSRFTSAIVAHKRLARDDRAWLLGQIRQLDGSPARARTLAKAVERRARRNA